MGRPKGTKNKKVVEKKTCVKCGRELALSNFYNSSSPAFMTDQKVSLCKRCITENIDCNVMSTIYDALQLMDAPFLYNYWVIAMDKAPDNPWGAYIRMCNSGINEFAGLRYKDSIFNDTGTNDRNEASEHEFSATPKKKTLTCEEREEMYNKWGDNYTDYELIQFEKKYDMLKDNYPQTTAMHTEALLIYIRYRVREEIATAQGNVGEAQKWGALADKASSNAKINPSQLSKADLSGGLNGFGEMVRAVEKAVDIIEVLPKFKQKPQDVVDFTLLCYINYCRRLKNLPDVEYKEIWQFYEDRKEEYKRTNTDRDFKFEDEE